MLSEADHARVTAAVTAAERHTAGEIVTVVAGRSDAYHDVGLHWAVLAMLGVLAALAARPDWALGLWALVDDGWSEPPAGAALMVALVLASIAFLLVRFALAWPPLRMALTPGATKTRRVRRQALTLFRVAAERRTQGRTGVLIYLSLAEHRAEIIADAAIHDRVAADVWGHAMASLIAGVKDGRAGDGLAAAVEEVGRVLAEHFPIAEGDINELPDRVIAV